MGIEHGRSTWVHGRVSADTEAGVLQGGGDPINEAGRLTRWRGAKNGPREIRKIADALDDTKAPPEGLSLHVAAMEHAESELNAQLGGLKLHVRNIASHGLRQTEVVHARFWTYTKGVRDQVVDRGQLRNTVGNWWQVVVQDAQHVRGSGLDEDVFRQPKTFA
jgi:hypothetical protein